MTDAFPRSGRWPRALLLLALTLALHLLLVQWGKRQLQSAGPAPDEHEHTMTVLLRPVPPPTQPVSLPVVAPSAKTPSSRPRKTAPRPVHREPSIDPPDEPIRETVVVTSATPDAIAPPAPGQTPAGDATATDGTASAAAPADGGAQAADGDHPAGTHYQTDPPPPARLRYDVQATYNQMPVHGNGTLDWHTDGKTYQLNGRAEDFFFTFLDFGSSGEIDAFGVSPALYTEKRIRKAATNTHFDRARGQISFSASTETYPRHGGEQDRASLVWQLAAIGRGEPERYRPGGVIDLFVAGARDAEVWRLQILGQEDIALPTARLKTWHVVRMPQPGTYDQRIDIWLAPGLEWYPVRLRYTDTRKDGDYLEMSLTRID